MVVPVLQRPMEVGLLSHLLTKRILATATIDHKKVREERHNFDPSGHYSRPDVLKLQVNKERQSVLE